jgi:hypothetical protein
MGNNTFRTPPTSPSGLRRCIPKAPLAPPTPFAVRSTRSASAFGDAPRPTPPRHLSVNRGGEAKRFGEAERVHSPPGR